ncbi:CDP-diacylglycerol--serine O-phosphatidyltransferase [Candidatus Desulfosporosinus infrequens]|uniref:CDP-diacylglycerol--serine O-phosphatidyltransferase n=1 Tax=Candidatus Desulfosporosinus infrequens TaxID=2043169 RepID=A0A2U3LXV0_9FIRM|nr:CDP-diacylglycerol--serine O-phosphatidyltransferase [Candidatus Desulfosporosinus infrequens]
MRGSPIPARMIPSIFTLANLLFGFLALIWVIEANYTLAATMILLSVLMDSLDGKVARRLSVSSDFGKELDSLSDLVSFGVAPSILTYQAILQPQLPLYIRYVGLGIAVGFALCGAVRLARFNMLNITTHFVGVPITFAGGFMALLMFLRNMMPWYIYPASMIILAFLMVSTFKVPKLSK